MSNKTAVVDTVTGLFHEDGSTSANTIVVAVPDNPDPIKHRYSGDPKNPIRNATSEEIAAVSASKADALATRAFDGERLIKAVAIAGLWGRLGRKPTDPEIVAERTRIVNIYKTLG